MDLEVAEIVPKGFRDVDLVSAITTAREAERHRWMECALYDATLPKPTFKGWNRSALDRLRLEVEAALALTAVLDEYDGPTRTMFGRMTITLWDYGGGAVVPEVSFDPIGRIQPATIDRFLQPVLYREILRAQALQRRGDA